MINVSSPQQQQRAQLRQMPNTRVQAKKAPQISSEFTQVLGQRFDMEARKDLAQNREMLRLRAKENKFQKDKFINERDRLVIGAKAEIANLKGESAEQAIQERRRKLEEDIQGLYSGNDAKFGGVASNPELKQIFQMESGRGVNNFLRTAVPHSYNEKEKARFRASEQVVKNTTEIGIEFSSDIEGFSGYIAAAEAVAREDAALKFGGQDSEVSARVRNAYVGKTLSEMVKGAIALQASRGAVEDAKSLKEKYGDRLLSDDMLAVEKLMGTAEVKNESNVAMAISDRHANIDDPVLRDKRIKEEIEALPDSPSKTKIYEKASALSRADFARKKASQRKQMASSFSSAMDQVNSYLDRDERVPDSVISNAPAEYQARIFNYIEDRSKGSHTTDQDTYFYLMDKWKNGELTPEMVMENYDRLDERTRNRMITKAEAEIKSVKSRESRIDNQTAKSYYDVLKNYTDTLLTNKDFRSEYRGGGKIELTSEDKYKLADAFENAFERLQDVDGLTPQQIRRRLHKALRDTPIQATGATDFIPFNEETVVPEQLNVDLEPPTPATEYPDVHRSYIDMIEAEFLRQGKTPTRESVSRALDNIRSQNINVSEPYQK